MTPRTFGDLPVLSASVDSDDGSFKKSRSQRATNVALSQILPKSRFKEVFSKKDAITGQSLVNESLPTLSKELKDPQRLLPISTKNIASLEGLKNKFKKKPEFSETKLLPDLELLRNKQLFSDFALRHKDKLLRLLSNDSTLPKLDLGSRGTNEETVKNLPVGKSNYNILNQNHSSKKMILLQRSVPKERPIKIEYYLRKVQIAASLPQAVMSQGFLDHFQRNYTDLKSLKNDKLIVDYHLKQVQLPPTIHDHVLVLDLDETLVHCCNFDQSQTEGTVTLPLKSALGAYQGLLKFNVRPGVDKFLKKMAEHFQVVVFTASDRQYAKTVLDFIDPNQSVCKLLTRDSCSFTRAGNVVKDLRVLKDKDVSKLVLVDNLAKCSFPQLDNAIPVLPFIDNQNDNELEELGQFLLKLAEEADIPAYLRRYFKFHRFTASPSHNHLLDELLNKVNV